MFLALLTNVPPVKTGVFATETGVSVTETWKSVAGTGVFMTETGKAKTETGVSITKTGKSEIETGEFVIKTGWKIQESGNPVAGKMNFRPQISEKNEAFQWHIGALGIAGPIHIFHLYLPHILIDEGSRLEFLGVTIGKGEAAVVLRGQNGCGFARTTGRGVQLQ